MGVLGKTDWVDEDAMKKVLGRANISLLMLQTLVTEIEALLNDRPLTYVARC